MGGKANAGAVVRSCPARRVKSEARAALCCLSVLHTVRHAKAERTKRDSCTAAFDRALAASRRARSARTSANDERARGLTLRSKSIEHASVHCWCAEI